MAKVHPQSLLSSSTTMASASKSESFTIWMKSLVMNGNGCTVYDSNGCIAYRVDNYDCKSSDEVYLMDHSGKTLMKRFRVFGRWEGYRCSGSSAEEMKPWFRVQKACQILRGEQPSEITVTVGCGSGSATCYKIEGSAHDKLEYRIMDMLGKFVAQMKRKHTASGVSLGEDVLTLVVKPNVDQLLIMGLVVVCGLISHSM